MRISYFLTHFPYENKPFIKTYPTGGAETVAISLAKVLAQKGHEIFIFTSSANSSNEVEEYNGLAIYRYGTNFKFASSRFSLGLLKNPRRYPTDLVHVHASVPMGDLAGFLYAKKKQKPLIVTLHLDLGSYKGFAIKLGYSLYCMLIGKLLSWANVIISPSRYYISEIRALDKYKDKVIVIPNGIDVGDFNAAYSREDSKRELGFSPSDRLLLYVGNFEPRKGLDILIKAMPRILKEAQNTNLVLVGDGIMRDKLEALAKKLGVAEHVKFTGFVNKSEKIRYYKSADIFILPSLYEIFGIVNLEAMACGIPVVASKVGGIPEVVKDGKNGLLIPPGNSEALADALIYLLENEDVREKMGKSGRKKVEGYSWERIAEETEKVYNEVLSS